MIMTAYKVCDPLIFTGGINNEESDNGYQDWYDSDI